MNDYQQVRLDVKPCDEIKTDILASMLADAGFESFVPDADGLTAFVRSEDFDRDVLDGVVASFPLDGEVTVAGVELVEGRDWNAEWERNYFKPIVIDDQCAIHSSFHRDVPVCRYDIVIDPKMAFGTGHHATTTLILRRLLAADLQDKSLIDMGTGTGILAILAAMRGASPVTGIEIDSFAHVNAVENVAVNGHSEIDVRLGDASLLADYHDTDYFVANINRNIITGDMPRYVAAVKTGGRLIFSGFYVEDIPVVRERAESLGLTFVNYTEMERWVSVMFTK